MRGAAQDIAGAADQLHFPCLEPVIIGMPELCRAGLSENWLLKACGHRHWLALAQAHGLPRPDFRDRDGERLYPAFSKVRIAGARLETVMENMRLAFAVTLRRASRTRFRSDILVTCDDLPVAAVAMETTFIRRGAEGTNRSAYRAIVSGPCSLMPPPPAQHRQPAWEENGEPLATLVLDPSPHEDFNGAGFLYFSAYQAMLDRAAWRWFRQADPVLVTTEREITYLGNAEPGDPIRATLCDGDAFRHRIELSRCSDGHVIARARSVARNL